MSLQVPSSKDDNAPDGAITKSVRSGTLLAPKEYPEKCRCSACSGPTRLALGPQACFEAQPGVSPALSAEMGAPAGAAVFPWHVRRSVLANAKSVAFALTASRAQPIARRPAWAGESNRFARRRTPPSHPNGPAKAGPRQNANHPHALPAMQVPAPCGPAKAGPWQNLNLSHTSKAMKETPAPAPQGGLGATPPFKITRSRTRRGARRMPLGAAMGLAVAKPGPRRALARWGSEQGWPLRGQPARGRCRRHAARDFGAARPALPRQGRGSSQKTPLRFHRRSTLFPPTGFGGLGAPAFRKFGPFYFVGAGFLAERKPSGFRAQGPGRALRGWAARNGGPGGAVNRTDAVSQCEMAGFDGQAAGQRSLLLSQR